MIDRTNENWNKTITDEEIYNEKFCIGYLIQNNQHLDLFKQLKDLVLSTYKVVAKFTYLGYNGAEIIANNQVLIWRNKKFSDFSIGKNVTIIKHNFSHKQGGSHSHPSIAYSGAECILEFISYGLPFVNKTNGWSIEIISIMV